MKKIISIFSLIFYHSLAFANVETPYPEEYMEFFGCGNKTQFTMDDQPIYNAQQQPYESANLLRDYRSSFNQYPKPTDGIPKAGGPKKEAAIAARDKYRKERDRINEIFKQKEEAYCAAQKPNPILNYKDIEKLSIVDFANIINRNYFSGNYVAFDSIEQILNSEFGNGFIDHLSSSLLSDVQTCSSLSYEELQSNLIQQYGKRNMDQVNAKIEHVKLHCATVLKVKTGDYIEKIAQKLTR